jgi:hypothetical protein
MRVSSLAVALVGIAPMLGAQTQSGTTETMQLYPPPTSMKWYPGPAALPKGVMSAVLEGDPTKPGLFTMRLKFPAGTKVMPHFHSATEHATVISGALYIGMGDKFDMTMTRLMPAGSFGFWTPAMHHFGYFEVETVLQLHGEGPWTATYVNPADDPRKQSP